MFDNPEKLFIILLIALFIFGPQKLIGLGGALGRAMRDFRGAVRDAQDSFHSAAEELKPDETYVPVEPIALPAPEPVETMAPLEGEQADLVPAAAEPAPEAPHAADDAADLEGPHSLASEPSAQAVQEILQRKE
jgi:TatA/E family protein of Tat protein translocase